jgi:5-methyltetrahydropteroyltriglutamate--homocysteine methyltransferase
MQRRLAIQPPSDARAMAERSGPPFRADHVGSFLRPPALHSARAEYARGNLSAAQLRERENDAIKEIIQQQEDIGLRSVTDGEFRRTWFHLDFLRHFSNVTVGEAKIPARFRTADGVLEMHPPALRVIGKISRPHAIFVDDFKFTKSATRETAKLTIPSPSAMHFRGGRAAIDTAIYPDIEEFYADVARGYADEIRDLGTAGCTYLQLDEVNLAYLCDPALDAQVRAVGEDPATLPATYAKLINASIAGRSEAMTLCMHLCRGNFRSGWVAEGGYEAIADLLFNEIAVDGYFLEYDSERAGNFEPLRFVPKDKIIVLGLVSSKTAALERKDDLKRRVEQASRYVALDQLALSPQCGFASTVEGNRLTADDQFAKLRLVVEVAREIWG